ncbi:uncharacterized protein DNG_07300 [Cephalotrichum gorgonifer]|uniref:Transcription factor domain-containing protein n=1 Tax=Cephalotrichum gorgonifer TaxID=2041049 RepID=A0AAE8N4C7_9PEZI|nr:uncharacterized protein DNG_07300 [Cephalotrichum gorgonifer]
MDDVHADANPDKDPECHAGQRRSINGEAGPETFSRADLDFLDLNFNVHDSAWLLGSNFDIAALNDTITTAISGWGNRNPGTSYSSDRPPDIGNNVAQLNSTQDASQPLSSVQQNWHTRISRGGPPPTSPDAPSSSDKGHVDEAYRTDLSYRLRPTIDEHVLPSADFLWDSYIRRDRREVLSLIQAATIGQTFGMLSGHPSDLILTESFHGTVIAWARQGGFLKARRSSELTQVDNHDSSLEGAWKAWARREESYRLAIGLHIHDAEFATTFHHEPLLRHTSADLPGCCSEKLFSAATAAQWQELLNNPPRTHNDTGCSHQSLNPPLPLLPPSESHMVAYAALSRILASIQEMRCFVLDAPSVQQFRDTLLTWYNDFSGILQRQPQEPTSLHILWHEAFLILYADFDLLERAIGRDGPMTQRRAEEDAKQWSVSSEARRSVLHALFILKHIDKLPNGAGVAIHVPKALFYSGIVIYNYITSATGVSLNTPVSHDDLDIPEFRVSEQTGAMDCTGSDVSSQAMFSHIDASILCYIVDLLRRVGHWGISRRYASILENLLDNLAWGG